MLDLDTDLTINPKEIVPEDAELINRFLDRSNWRDLAFDNVNETWVSTKCGELFG